MCWQCWYRISENNGRAKQAIDEINKVDGCQITATDVHSTEINMESDHWYRLAKRFEDPDKRDMKDTAMKCATCGITNVLVSQKEIQTHCGGSKECMKTDVRESAKTWKSSELHVRKNDDDIYDWSHHDTLAEDTSDDEENLQMEPVERNSKREVRDYVVVEICGVEPKGSQYRVKWESYNNKKRGEVMKLESVLNSSQLITEYLLSASGITRMNTIKKMFNAAASVKTQKSQLISSFSYKSWTEQVKNHALPHKYIHRVVLLQLQQSGCRSQDSLREHLKNKLKFPEKAMFTAWVIPRGLHNRRIGSVVVPVTSEREITIYLN
jgi:hypothetical protein